MNSEERPAGATFTNKKGQQIFYRNWICAGRPKGVVVIVHGLNSHSGYYQNFATELNEHKYEVYAIDLAGRGKSEGERFYISDYQDVIDDVDLLVEIAICEHPATSVFLLGHSAGGVFASVYALQYQYKLKGLIAESFAFDLPVPGFALAAIKFLSLIIPHTRMVTLKNEDFSRDQHIVDTMNTDPLLAGEKQPTKTMQQLLLAGEYLRKNMSEIMLPLFVLHGTADKATNPSGSEFFEQYAGSQDKRLQLYEGHFHDLLNDKYNRIVISDITGWLNERV